MTGISRPAKRSLSRSSRAGSRSNGDTHDLGDRLARDVVLGSAQATATNDGVSTLERRPQGRDDPRVVVAHLGLLETRDPHRRQLLTDPGRICIYDLAEQELGPDGQDLAVHGLSL